MMLLPSFTQWKQGSTQQKQGLPGASSKRNMESNQLEKKMAANKQLLQRVIISWRQTQGFYVDTARDFVRIKPTMMV